MARVVSGRAGKVWPWLGWNLRKFSQHRIHFSSGLLIGNVSCRIFNWYFLDPNGEEFHCFRITSMGRWFVGSVQLKLPKWKFVWLCWKFLNVKRQGVHAVRCKLTIVTASPQLQGDSEQMQMLIMHGIYMRRKTYIILDFDFDTRQDAWHQQFTYPP